MSNHTEAWLFTDGAMGNVKQARVLAAGLALPAREWTVRLSALDRAFAPRWRRASLADLALTPPLPDTTPTLAIGCGRAGAVALDALKRSQPSLRTVQILDPRCDPARFDAIVCPEHDRLRGGNVFTMPGAFSAVDDVWLAAARSAPAFSAFSTLLLVGAPTRNAPYGEHALSELLQRLPRAGLRISSSRRTPPELTRCIAQFWAQHELPAADLFIPTANSAGENPYSLWLAGAARIIVTADSVNMLSEACAASAAVEIAFAERARGKIARFHGQLGTRLQHQNQTPLRPTVSVIAQLKAFLGL